MSEPTLDFNSDARYRDGFMLADHEAMLMELRSSGVGTLADAAKDGIEQGSPLALRAIVAINELTERVSEKDSTILALQHARRMDAHKTIERLQKALGAEPHELRSLEDIERIIKDIPLRFWL